ncbi:nucleoside kinase [Halanaerobiaceae bacterium Z-7014]|uniref:Nucleoside kinase n=1 Tax=Halonatronomonas betaini TaxID=2778430 RepID=A0A931FAA3_9FIRM|nr:nucleoside kinase [Halonatronomonas betaini]MBF8436752.1 nucleoside kinase [Halonatronomonas betaini]
MLDLVIDGEKYSFPKGMELSEIFSKTDLPNNKFVAAVVENELVRLNFIPEDDIEIKSISRGEELGNRIYRRSLFLLLAKAVYELFPDSRLKIEHSLSNGIYCEIFKGKPLTRHDLKKLKIRMSKYVEKDIEIKKELMDKNELIEIYQDQGFQDKIDILSEKPDGEKVEVYNLDGYYDYFYYELLPSTRYLDKFDLHYSLPGFVLLFPQQIDSGKVPEFVDSPKLANIFIDYERLGEIIGVGYVNDLNNIIREDDGEELIRISEAIHEKNITKIADNIYDEIDTRRVILIAGPSSSGKTTFSHRLATHLRIDGLKPVNISIDDYFVNRDETPLDKDGNLDFEALEAIDLELFNDHLLRLLQGERVELPEYNFETGKREYNGNYLQIEDDQPILIEGIHGLNERLTEVIPKNHKYKIYVSALTQLNMDYHNRIPTSDTRFIRRIVRDHKYRGHDAETTIDWWPKVRKGEEKNIFPYQENADVIFNSALIYELAVLKKHLIPLLDRIDKSSPAYYEAVRLKELVEPIVPMPELTIPPISVLREFIGGNSYRR